jgi:CheY-like chemotaxis protein
MKTILIVEDEFGIADALRDVLVEEGYGIELARNGREGLDALNSARPDLIIVDLMMPIMDGREMIRQLRASETLKTIPVILMSAVAHASIRRDVEVEGFLRKPFNLDALLELVQKLLNQ